MRRDFPLPDEDTRALDVLGCDWEVVSAPARHLLIHGMPLPVGYNVPAATAVVRLDSYPPGPLDMVYFSPSLSRADGKPIGAVSQTSIGQRRLQQWSRHYRWRHGEDTLASHLGRIRSWLRGEFRKR